MSTLRGQAPTTGLQFTRSNRQTVQAEIYVRRAMSEVLRNVIASIDPDVNSKSVPNPRLKYSRAVKCSGRKIDESLPFTDRLNKNGDLE